MGIFNNIAEKPRAIAVGTFDGVHRGHHCVLEALKEKSKKKGLTPTVISFNRHPLEVIAPQRAPRMLSESEQREDFIRFAGCEPIIINFDENLASLTAREWMTILKDELNAELLVVGYDNTFGCDGISKNVDDYIHIGNELGIEVIEAPCIPGISSSKIRKLIANGKIEEANEMLGYDYMIAGEVVHGRELGRKLGFPTANIQPAPSILLPGSGVYVGKVIMPDGEIRKACVNVGNAPTLGASVNTTVEAHIIGDVQSLYGLILPVIFIHKLRDEKKFPSFDALSEAIKKDVENTIQYFLKNT